MLSLAKLQESAIAELKACNEVPFCKQKFKFARVVWNDFYSHLTRLAYSLFSFEIAAHRAAVEGSRCLQQSKWTSFGDRLIDFSVNATFVSKQFGLNDPDIFQRSYQLQDLNWRPAIGKINRNMLSVKEEAFCAGLSAHFLYLYLKQLQSGSSPAEAVEKIAPLYRHGPPKTAQIVQILNDAFDLKDEVVEIVNETQNVFNFYLSYLSYLITISLDAIKRIANFVCAFFGFDLQVESKVEEDFDTHIANHMMNSAVELTKNKPMYKLFGIEIDEIFPFEPRNLSKEKFEEEVQKIPIGSYQVSLLSGSGKGHSIVFIKTGTDVDFIFDPNVGTYKVEACKSPIGFARLMQRYYPKAERNCSIDFHKCQLNLQT